MDGEPGREELLAVPLASDDNSPSSFGERKTTTQSIVVLLTMCHDQILEVAKGLEYLHKQKEDGDTVVHGCLRPSNVLIDDQNRALINDFRFAKELLEDGDAPTGPGDKEEPSRYSPLADGVMTPALDIFSWACTALYILSERACSS